MDSVVHRLYAAWRAMEALASAAEHELFDALRAQGVATPELVLRVRQLRSEASFLFKTFVEEADRTAASLRSRVS